MALHPLTYNLMVVDSADTDRTDLVFHALADSTRRDIVAGTTQAAITWLQGGIDLPREEVIAEIARLILTAMSPGHG